MLSDLDPLLLCVVHLVVLSFDKFSLLIKLVVNSVLLKEEKIIMISLY